MTDLQVGQATPYPDFEAGEGDWGRPLANSIRQRSQVSETLLSTVKLPAYGQAREDLREHEHLIANSPITRPGSVSR